MPRSESTEYRSASLARICDLATALDLDIVETAQFGIQRCLITARSRSPIPGFTFLTSIPIVLARGGEVTLERKVMEGRGASPGADER